MIQTAPPQNKCTTFSKVRKDRILEGFELVKKLHNIYIHRYQLFRYMSKDDLEDIRQDCVVEMIHAVDRFDVSKNVKLTTYLNYRIQGFFKDVFKHYAKQRQLSNKDTLDISLDFVCKEINEILDLNKKQAFLYFSELNVSKKDSIKNVLLDISYTQDSYEIFDSLTSLPDSRIYIILGYYIMNKSIKEISQELGFGPDTGWVYRMKRESIAKLQKLLIKKKMLKEK